jgi:energy-coupling factor transport system permease protein
MSTHHRTHRAATPSGRTPRTVPATGRPWSWRGIDLITAAMLAVAFGVVFWGFDTFVYPAVSAATTAFPPLGALSLGVWLIPAVVGALVVRRPGAALFTELVAANVELFLGNKWGIAVLLSGVLQGLGVELVVAAGRWRRFSPATAVVGGIMAAVLEVVCYEWWAYTPDYSPAWKAVYLLCGVISGAVIAGLGGWALVRYLARAGALDAFPAGQEARESAAAR